MSLKSSKPLILPVLLAVGVLGASTLVASAASSPSKSQALSTYQVSQEDSPAEAIRKAERAVAGVCDQTINHRTTSMHLVNNTAASIKLAFFQGKQTVGAPPTGYVADTGVYVGCMNEPGGANCDSDPCYAGGYQRPIMVDRCSGSVEITYNGQNQTFNLPAQQAPNGKFWIKCGWTINWRQALTGAPELVFEPEMDVMEIPNKQ